MADLKDLQKDEALKRLMFLGLEDVVVQEFKEKNVVYVSENIGYLFYLDKEQKEYVKKFEELHDALVYHVIKSSTSVGTLLSFFYVCSEKDEWEMDLADLKEGYASVYVKNLDFDDCSEFGSICFKKNIGGLMRIA